MDRGEQSNRWRQPRAADMKRATGENVIRERESMAPRYRCPNGSRDCASVRGMRPACRLITFENWIFNYTCDWVTFIDEIHVLSPTKKYLREALPTEHSTQLVS